MDTKKLRQKILDLAIRGKLVPQDPNDEPASVLLERIRAEKEQLIKEGKIKCSKKSAATDKSHYENVPFEIPENWVWTTLGEISNYGQCENVDVDKIAANEWILELEDIEKDSGRIIQKLCKDDRKACGTRHKFYRNEILYSKLRTYLNKVLVAPSSGFCTSEIIPIHCIETNPWFICFVLRSNYFLDYTASLGYGVKMPRLGTNDALISYIPLPPLSEQARIVDEVAKWNIIIDEIEDDKLELEAYVKKTKSKILDLAISGKLVPQELDDEPAIELLKRINPGFKPCDNSHYGNLPQGWAVCRLEDILDYEQPQAYIVNSTDYSDEYDTPVLTAGKSFIIGYTNETNGICDRLPVIIFDDFTTDSKLVDFPFKVKSSAMKILRTKGEINIDYIAYYMSITRLIGDTHKRYWISEYSKLLIPIPPYQEQLRIVETIEIIFDKIHKITAELS